MVCRNVMRMVGSLVAVLVVKTKFAGADISALQMRALMTTSTSTTECAAEGEACMADSECAACIDAYAESADSCFDGLTSASFTCPEFEDAICCASTGCWDNAIFGDAFECAYSSYGCGLIDIATCTGGAVSGGTSTTDTTPTTADSSTTAATDDTTPSTTNPCQAEVDACAEDEACSACLEAAAADSDAVESICQPPGFDVDTATCDERLEVSCCAVDEGPACMTSDALMVALAECAWESTGCGSSFDCAVAADSSATAEGDDATSATASNGDDEADVVDADEDDDDANDADAADTDSDSANPGATVRGAVTVFVAAVVSLVFMNA
eukprot:g1592.t1